MKDFIKAVVFGHAIGDALGVPVEFIPREKLDKTPVTDMLGYGIYPVPAGAWSDDTSMSLCALDSLANGKLDYDEIMRNFDRWYNHDEFTPTDWMFDVGTTCSYAIDNYVVGKMPYDECGLSADDSNGNGSLMRIHPFVLFAEYTDRGDEMIDIIDEASSLTHAHRRSLVGCGIYAFILRAIMKNQSKDAVYSGLAEAKEYYEGESELKHYSRLFSPDFALTDRSDIKSTGYVVHTLEAAVWCLLTTESYEECVMKAVNLGEDTDTVAAVAGGLAGAMYGFDAIPKKWRDGILKKEFIEEMCERAYKNWNL